MDKSENFPNFAQENDEPAALAFTDFSKPSPVLEGEDAERFIRNMEEAEQKARERASRPKTRSEIESELSVKKMLLEFQEREINELKKEIENLERLYAEAEKE